MEWRNYNLYIYFRALVIASSICRLVLSKDCDPYIPTTCPDNGKEFHCIRQANKFVGGCAKKIKVPGGFQPWFNDDGQSLRLERCGWSIDQLTGSRKLFYQELDGLWSNDQEVMQGCLKKNTCNAEYMVTRDYGSVDSQDVSCGCEKGSYMRTTTRGGDFRQMCNLNDINCQCLKEIRCPRGSGAVPNPSGDGFAFCKKCENGTYNDGLFFQCQQQPSCASFEVEIIQPSIESKRICLPANLSHLVNQSITINTTGLTCTHQGEPRVTTAKIEEITYDMNSVATKNPAAQGPKMSPSTEGVNESAYLWSLVTGFSTATGVLFVTTVIVLIYIVYKNYRSTQKRLLPETPSSEDPQVMVPLMPSRLDPNSPETPTSNIYNNYISGDLISEQVNHNRTNNVSVTQKGDENTTKIDMDINSQRSSGCDFPQNLSSTEEDGDNSIDEDTDSGTCIVRDVRDQNNDEDCHLDILKDGYGTTVGNSEDHRLEVLKQDGYETTVVDTRQTIPKCFTKEGTYTV